MEGKVSKRKRWLHWLCLAFGTSFTGKDGHRYGPKLR